MNKFFKQSVWVVVVLLMLLVISYKAFADTRVAQINSKLPELYKFISDHSDYTTTNVPSSASNGLGFKLQFKSAEQLMQIYYGPMVNLSDPSNFAVQAVYSGGTMILRDDFDIDTMSHVLLHELVHHVQFMSGRAFECPQAMEWEAYDIMDKYVEHSGVGEKTDPLFKMLMTCKTDMEFR